MPHVPKDEWIPRFARKLRELIPEVAGEEAMSLAFAESMFPEAEELTAEEAAEIYLLEEHPGGVSSPGA
jgi:hypothetical protein